MNWFGSVQFSSVIQLFPTLYNPMNQASSMPGLPVHHQFLEPTQTHVHCVSDAIPSSHPLLSPSSAFNLFLTSGSFPVSWLFASGDQSIGASASEASASVLPMNIQG